MSELAFSIQTNDPLAEAQTNPTLDELEGQYIWLPPPVPTQVALRLLDQLYPGLRWAGGQRVTKFYPPIDINGFVIYGNSLHYTHNATSDSPFRILPDPIQLVRIT